MTTTVPRRLIGIMGDHQSTVSAVGTALRQYAGTSGDEGCDLEFSGPLIQTVNLARLSGGCARYVFRKRLVLATQSVLTRQVKAMGKRWFHTCNLRPRNVCPECRLLDWHRPWSMNGMPTLNRSNKLRHQAPLTWLREVIPQLSHKRIWLNEVVRRIELVTPDRLVTVGDVCRPAEAEMIRALGGLILQVTGGGEREFSLNSVESWEVTPDVVFGDQGSVEAMAAGVAQFWDDYQSGRPLRPSYGASLVRG